MNNWGGLTMNLAAAIFCGAFIPAYAMRGDTFSVAVQAVLTAGNLLMCAWWAYAIHKERH
jgi:hypothetical protein